MNLTSYLWQGKGQRLCVQSMAYAVSRFANFMGVYFQKSWIRWRSVWSYWLRLVETGWIWPDSTFGSQLWDIVCKTDRCHHFVPAGILLCCRALQIRYVVKANQFWRRGGDLLKYWIMSYFSNIGFSQWISQAMPRELFFPDLWRTKGRCSYLDLPLFPAQQQNRRWPDWYWLRSEGGKSDNRIRQPD